MGTISPYPHSTEEAVEDWLFIYPQEVMKMALELKSKAFVSIYNVNRF